MKDELFYKYFLDWFNLFRKPRVRPVTAIKYKQAANEIEALAPNLRLNEINRMAVQKLLVKYGKNHEMGTADGFFHMVRSCLQNAQYDGLIDKDPTYKLQAESSVTRKPTRAMYLEKDQAACLAKVFKKHRTVYTDLFDFDMRTGLRLAELLGLTPKDVDLDKGLIKISKSWLYKQADKADFGETKNRFSHRTIPIDDLARQDITRHLTNCGRNEPIFVKALTKASKFKPAKKHKYVNIYDGKLNRHLTRCCKEAQVPRITVHGLRHTHASLLFSAGISILSISKRLGHANTTTTEKVYVHLIQDQAERDNAKMINALNTLGDEESAQST